MRQPRSAVAAVVVVLFLQPFSRLAAQDEVDAARLFREIPALAASYQRGLRVRTASVGRERDALRHLGEAVERVSAFQREASLDQARRKVAEAREVLEKEAPMPDAAIRVLENMETLLRQVFPNEPVDKLRARMLVVINPLEEDLLQRAAVLKAEGDVLRNLAFQLRLAEDQATAPLPEVYRALLAMGKLRVDNGR